MSLGAYAAVLFVIFFSFSIGFNLGLHGVISLDTWHQTNPKDHAALIFQEHDTATQLSNAPGTFGTAKEISVVTTTLPDPPTAPKQAVKIKVDPLQADKYIYSSLLENQEASSSLYERTSNALRDVRSRYSGKASGPLEKYIANGGSIPIALLTYNRHESLDRTLASLFSVTGVQKSDVLILQDGGMREIVDVAKKHGVEVVQNTEGMRMRGAMHEDGASRIAKHYKFSLTTAFKKRPTAPAIIVIEDDLLFSPDFLEYFKHVVPVLEKDPTVFIASAWSDNGFKEKVRDNYALRRTEFFPGLGWLLTRTLYEGELEMAWPDEHWDHWLRSESISKHREIVYPQVPRSFHNGVVGTFMNLDTHNRYFRDIAYNQEHGLEWAPLSYIQGAAEVYEARIFDLIDRCTHAQSLEELKAGGEGKVYCIWIDVNPEPLYNGIQEFELIGSFFGIWHEHKRGVHKSMHEFYWENRYILLLNIFTDTRRRAGQLGSSDVPSYKHLRPPQIKTIARTAFSKSAWRNIS